MKSRQSANCYPSDGLLDRMPAVCLGNTQYSLPVKLSKAYAFDCRGFELDLRPLLDDALAADNTGQLGTFIDYHCEMLTACKLIITILLLRHMRPLSPTPTLGTTPRFDTGLLHKVLDTRRKCSKASHRLRSWR